MRNNFQIMKFVTLSVKINLKPLSLRLYEQIKLFRR